MHCERPRDYHSLGLTRIQFHPPKVTPLTNHAKVTDQDSATVYCAAINFQLLEFSLIFKYTNGFSILLMIESYPYIVI